MWKILQETVFKTHITDLDLSTMPLTNGYRNAHSVLTRCFSLFRSVMRVLYTGFAIIIQVR